MKYFIDTNIIIDFLNKDEDVINRIVALLEDDTSEIYINRLVLLESLRTIHFNSKKLFIESKEALKCFESLEIRPNIYNDAIDFSRYCHSKGLKLKGKCEAIAFLYFITAKYYNLEIIRNDKDFDKLEKTYQHFK